MRKLFFAGSSRVTDHFPRVGSRILDLTLMPFAGSVLLSGLFARRNRRIVRGLASPGRFLVIPDIHIGDSVISQSALTAIRDFFPEATVDYVVNVYVLPLLNANPEASQLLPLYSGGCFPSPADLSALRRLIRNGNYGLCLNFCPFIADKDIAPRGQAIVNILTRAPQIVRNERCASPINHFFFQTYRFTRDLLSIFATPVRPETRPGAKLWFSDQAVEKARVLASEWGLSRNAAVIMYNPDGASVYTRLPFDKQEQLLSRLLRRRCQVLLGAGHSALGIGKRLKAALPDSLSGLVKIIPADLSLETYAALIDFCDVFVSGDTGPLHLAAARKYSQSGRYVFRNRTAVLSLFGATPARMSGYDSSRPGFLAANQDAPSWAYTAGSPCRNITCVNKLFKTCRSVRCFEEVDVEGLAGRVTAYLESLADRTPAHRGPAAT